MSTPIPKVQKTGRFVQHRDGTLHEVICPECQIPQFHRPGILRCLICNARWQLVALEIIHPDPPVDLPDSNP